MKYFICFFSLVSILLLHSCTEESPLSDIDITDPSLIQLDVSLFKSIDYQGNLNSRIWVYLYDKNQNLIKLKNGKVSVNGHAMILDEIGLNKAPYYTIDARVLSVEAQKEYAFTIELSDGKAYLASITTQNIDLYEINIPFEHSKNSNMQISWKGYDTQSDLVLTLNCAYSNTKSSGQVVEQFHPGHQERTKGEFVFASSNFNKQEGIYRAFVSITSTIKGTVDPHFRANSSITSMFSIEDDCNIK